MEHIDNMDQLKQGIGLRAYGQNDPVKEYTNEGFAMFEDMIQRIQEDTVRYIYNVQIKVAPKAQSRGAVDLSNAQTNEAQIQGEEKQQTVHKKKIGRNEPCPCGSGKKYKNCCGA